MFRRQVAAGAVASTVVSRRHRSTDYGGGRMRRSLEMDGGRLAARLGGRGTHRWSCACGGKRKRGVKCSNGHRSV
jgi:hypothetical protein